MFSCRNATDLMTDEGEHALSGRNRFFFGVHMTICAHCRNFRRQLRETIRLVREIPSEKDAPPPELEDALAAAFRARKR